MGTDTLGRKGRRGGRERVSLLLEKSVTIPEPLLHKRGRQKWRPIYTKNTERTMDSQICVDVF